MSVPDFVEVSDDGPSFSELAIVSAATFIELRSGVFGSQYGAGKYGTGPYGGARSFAGSSDGENPQVTSWTEINES